MLIKRYKLQEMKTLTLLSLLSLCICLGCENDTEKNTEIQSKKVRRFGWVIKVKPEKLEEYKVLHANPWPGVNAMIKECNIQNYSIYYRDGFLYSYMEYTGIDFEADMQKMAADSVTQEWWKLTDPCQEPVESAGEGVKWAEMEEVYHLD